jgi:hypothetical protein
MRGSCSKWSPEPADESVVMHPELSETAMLQNEPLVSIATTLLAIELMTLN